MVFTCSYCDVIFHDFHHELECRDRLIEAIYNQIIKLDKQRLKIILNHINLISL
jgi:hypothetical protein